MKYREFAQLLPGGEAVLEVDLCVLNDNLSLQTLELLRKKQIFDNTKVLIIIDQIVPPNSAEQSGIQRQLMRLSEEQQISICIGSGMTSHYLCDGRVHEGEIVAAVNETVAAVGAVGAYGLNMTEEEIVTIFEKGQVKIVVPEKVEVRLTGTLADNCTARDGALAAIKKLGVGTQQGKALYLGGEGADSLTLKERMNFHILLMQAGVSTVISDGKADVLPKSEMVTVVLNEVCGLAAVHNSYGEIQALSQLPPTNIQVVYIGGSSGGNIEDIKLVADTVRGRKIAYGVRLAVAPATSGIYQQMADAGYIQDILDAGGMALNQCADADIQCRIGKQEIMVSNDWKNRSGYAGYETSQVIITSTKHAVNAAISGNIGELVSQLASQPESEDTKLAFALEGRCWKFGDDIDTDIIIPTQYVCIPYEEMLHYAFAPLRPGLADLLEEGDIIVAGDNFGCGSSREMAAEVIAGNGVKCIVAKSFARIFFRNAINNGILLIECPELPDEVSEGDIVRVELNRQIVCNGKSYPISSIKENLYEIIADGGLVKNIEKKVRLGLL